MIETLAGPWPWYIAGPMIGLIVPLLLIIGGKVFGISSNLRHMCAAAPLPANAKPSFLRYDWKRKGSWNMVFVFGIALGGAVSVLLFGVPDAGQSISSATQSDLSALGVNDLSGLVPAELLSWGTLLSPVGLLVVVIGGFLIGFGARYAGGCTSGHAISGIANFQLPSLIAVLGFFAGGLLVTWVVYPLLLG